MCECEVQSKIFRKKAHKGQFWCKPNWNILTRNKPFVGWPHTFKLEILLTVGYCVILPSPVCWTSPVLANIIVLVIIIVLASCPSHSYPHPSLNPGLSIVGPARIVAASCSESLVPHHFEANMTCLIWPLATFVSFGPPDGGPDGWPTWSWRAQKLCFALNMPHCWAGFVWLFWLGFRFGSAWVFCATIALFRATKIRWCMHCVCAI